MDDTATPKKILIVGGGFGGVRAALELAKKSLPNTKIILVSNTPHFEYHATLYRVVTGRSPLEVCIPLFEIFEGKKVEVIEDLITNVDLAKKRLEGNLGSNYTFDYLILALGSETAYYNIPGLKELSFRFKSITEALRLKRHLHEMFSSCVLATDKERECALHFVIVGGGATGVELAGELALYTKQLAEKHKLDQELITIDLIQGPDRLLPSFSPDISKKAKERLEDLGVHVFLNKRVVKEDIKTVYLKDMQMKTKTVIWTAGVKPHHLYQEIKGLSFNEKGKVIVDEFLQPQMSSRPIRLRRTRNDNGVFVIGDAAATPYSGMAQTANHDGQFVATVIASNITGQKPPPYTARKPFYAMPIGPNWALFISDSITLSGIFGWWMRRFIDLQFFLSILPLPQALTAFRSDRVLWESCPICCATD